MRPSEWGSIVPAAGNEWLPGLQHSASHPVCQLLRVVLPNSMLVPGWLVSSGQAWGGSNDHWVLCGITLINCNAPALCLILLLSSPFFPIPQKRWSLINHQHTRFLLSNCHRRIPPAKTSYSSKASARSCLVMSLHYYPEDSLCLLWQEHLTWELPY